MGNKSAKSHSPAAAEARALVEQAITTYPVVVFSKTYCPYCVSAKSDIKRAGASVANFSPPKVYELDLMGAKGRAIQAYLAEKTGRRTVPNVFIGGVTVGGGDEVASYARRNILKQMLTQAPDRLAASKESQAPEPDSAEGIVEKAIEEHPVVIFSKSWCPYCITAKRHVATAAASIPQYDGAKVFELDEMGDLGNQIQEYLSQKTGRYTVPNVFVGGKTVGGGDDVAALASRGELLGMMSSAVEKVSTLPAAEDGNQDDSAQLGSAKVGPSMTPAEELVEQAISSHPVVVFSKSWCPYCTSAKSNLAAVGSEIPGYPEAKVFELDTMGELGDDVQRYLGEKTGQHTVPNVFIAGVPVGGGTEVAAYARQGELKQMLTNAYSKVDADVDTEEKKGPVLKEIVFGAGCFWGVELAFQRLVGVESTEVGYSNGQFAKVTYDAVCSGRTGSAEVVRVIYNPAVVSMKELLTVWEGRHDPTSLNKQGNDFGTQYRSAIFYNDEEQRDAIEEWRLEASGRFQKPIVTEVAPVKNYCAAESYHQRYLERRGQSAEKGSNSYIRCYG